MHINKFNFLVIISFILFLLSCEKVQNTTYRVFLANNSKNDVIVEFVDGSIKDTIYSDCRSNPTNACSVILIKESYSNQVIPEYTKEEFENKISTLKVYYYNSNNEKIYYGGSETYCKKIENWEYDYSEDDGYGLHEYVLRVKDE